MAGPASICERHEVLGLPVDVCTDVLEAALQLHGSGGGQLVTLNAEMTMTALALPDLGRVIRGADLVVPDGAGVVWALAMQGKRVRRSPGIELAHDLLLRAATNNWRVALVGGSAEVMASLLRLLPQRHPGLQLVMALHGYQPPEVWPELERQLQELKPDLVLAALGVPRQETWIERLRAGQPGLWMGVGGSFDVWSGHKQRAPLWMGKLQIEWLYRLLQEPSRWRRMLALPRFAWAVLNENPRKLAKQKQAAGRTEG
jgi:N-acetylglucosaminyldiphosphoundecaprenol N-acetyl-beta-D-mannosaminyltransferase